MSTQLENQQELWGKILDIVHPHFAKLDEGTPNELTQGVLDLITQIATQSAEAERERIANLLNKALNKHSKSISEGGLDYVKAFEEVEKLEHQLFNVSQEQQ